MADIRTYRNKLTGLVGEFPVEFGDIFKDSLVEVTDEEVSANAAEVSAVPATTTEPANTDAAPTKDTAPEGTKA